MCVLQVSWSASCFQEILCFASSVSGAVCSYECTHAGLSKMRAGVDLAAAEQTVINQTYRKLKVPIISHIRTKL